MQRSETLRHGICNYLQLSATTSETRLQGQFILYQPTSNPVAWPSGLRRWFKAPVSSEAWVRIPPLPNFFTRHIRIGFIKLFAKPILKNVTTSFGNLNIDKSGASTICGILIQNNTFHCPNFVCLGEILKSDIIWQNPPE